MLAIVKLDDLNRPAGPATIVELTTDPVSEVLKRYPNRDPRLRFWSAPAVSYTGERVILGTNSSPMEAR